MIRDYQDQLEYKPLQDGDAICDHQVIKMGLSILKQNMVENSKGPKYDLVMYCTNFRSLFACVKGH